MSSIKFERLKQEALSEGIIDRDLLRCLLSPLIPADLVTPATEVMRLLAEGFELGYSVTKRQRDSVFSLAPDVNSEGKAKLAKVLIPWLRRSAEPEDFREMWDSKEGNRKLAVYFRFPHYFPPGLFEIISVRAYKPGHSLRFKHHWGGGFHALHAVEKVHVVVSYARVEDECETKQESEQSDAVDRDILETAVTNTNEYEHDRTVRRTRSKKVVADETEEDGDEMLTNGDCEFLNEIEQSSSFLASDEADTDSETPRGKYSHAGVQKGGELDTHAEQEPEPEVESRRSKRESHVMLKYEVRDQSSDEAELTPAAAMWSLLLPLLMEAEELLNSYPGNTLVCARVEGGGLPLWVCQTSH